MKAFVIRGNALNKWEMQNYEPLSPNVTLVGEVYGSYDVSNINLPIIKLFSIDSILKRVPIFGRILKRILRNYINLEYLLGFENSIKGANILHGAETFIVSSEQIVKAKRLLNCKVVLTCWENIPFNYEENPKSRKRKQIVRDNTDLFLAVTQLAKTALILEGIPENKIKIIPAGVNQNHFKPHQKDQNLLSNIGIRNDCQIILYSGRMIREKGLTDLIEAARIIESQNGLDVHFVLVGNGPEISKLKFMVQKFHLKNRFTFIPSQPYNEMPNIYSIADVFVLPSVPTPYWKEQFGMVLVEAMACGKAIVTTNNGSISEVVGDAAILVPPYSPDALAKALSDVLQDENYRKLLENAAISRAKQFYDAIKISEKIREAYFELF